MQKVPAVCLLISATLLSACALLTRNTILNKCPDPHFVTKQELDYDEKPGTPDFIWQGHARYDVVMEQLDICQKDTTK